MLWWILAVVLVLAGLLGIVVPGMPGTVLILAGLWIAAWTDGFMRVGVLTLVILAVLTAASYMVDIVAVALGTKHLGASRRAMAGAAIGMAIGLFFGLPGVILGPFAGAVIGELTAQRDFGRAGRVGVAAWIGVVIGMAVKVGLAFGMVGIFVVAWIF
jgi:uncharacterized protein YqgC (DUF456 family)